MKVGDLVQHRRSGMKALVVDFDEDGDLILVFLGEPIEHAEVWGATAFEVI